MKLIFVQDSLGTGGAERSNAELWYFLRQRDIQFKILVFRHRKEGIEKEILNEGFDVDFLKPANILQQASNIAKIIKDYKPDLVHSVLFQSNIRVRLAKLFTNFTYLESLVSCPYDKERFQDPGINKFKLKLIQFIDFSTQKFSVNHFHPNGHAVAKHYKEKLLIPSYKMTVVHRGRKKNLFIEDENVKKNIKEEFDASDKLIFINVARHEYKKCPDLIIDAISRIPEFSEKALLINAGREGQLTKIIKEKINQYNLQSCVKLLGHRTDIYRLLAGSDVFVFPSRIEGLPGALIEAEAGALPIICSNIANNLEVVDVNSNALIFPVNDVAALAIQIKNMLNNKEKRLFMAEESLKKYNAQFTIEKINQQMLELFQSLIKSN